MQSSSSKVRIPSSLQILLEISSIYSYLVEPDRLYLLCTRRPPPGVETQRYRHRRFQKSRPLPQLQNSTNVHYVTVEDKFHYEPFYEDFGPINLGQTHIFCRMINSLMKVHEEMYCCLAMRLFLNRLNFYKLGSSTGE